MMFWTAERRRLRLISRAAEHQGPLLVRAPRSSGDPWGAGTPEVCQQPLLPQGPRSPPRGQRPWQTCKQELGGVCEGFSPSPSTQAGTWWRGNMLSSALPSWGAALASLREITKGWIFKPSSFDGKEKIWRLLNAVSMQEWTFEPFTNCLK